MNYNNFKDETSRMMELMRYGINENADSKTSAPRVEYSVKAADGKTYGIVNEGKNFYIKVAPPKNTQILNEDYDYIGGFMNKKANEYKSYALASRNLELKLQQINEAYQSVQTKPQIKKEQPQVDWIMNESKEMRAAINRMNEISQNVNRILTEGSIPSEHTLPEAPAKNPSSKKVNSPFVDTAVAKGDKDFKKTETDYEKPNGSPYSKATNAELTSDKMPRLGGDNGNAYSDKCQYVPNNSLAHSKAKGGKAVMAINEGKKRTVKLTEEQVLAWNREDDDYMDMSHGTQIGSSSPFKHQVPCKQSNQCGGGVEHIHEAEGPVHNSDTTLFKSKWGTGKCGRTDYGDPYQTDKSFMHKDMEHGVFPLKEDFNGVAGFEGYPEEEGRMGDEFDDDERLYDITIGDDAEGDEFDDDYEGEEPDFEDDEFEDDMDDDFEDDDMSDDFEDDEFEDEPDDFEDDEFEDDMDDDFEDGDMGDDFEDDMDDDFEDDDMSDDFEDDEFEDDMDDDFEGGYDDFDGNRQISEQELHVFGHHPAYRKPPFKLPPNKEVAKPGYRDWNDDSVEGEEPFGKQIGSSAPFDKTVKKITNSIMEQLGF